MTVQLTDEQRQNLIEQFVDAYAEEQKSYDASVRTIAAAGLAVTVTLATALETLTAAGVVAVFAFLVSLGLNVVSYQTSQQDLRKRIAVLAEGRDEGYQGGTWTTVTTGVNGAAGVALIAGGVALAVYVSRAI